MEMVNEKDLAKKIGVSSTAIRIARKSLKLDGMYLKHGRFIFYDLSDLEKIKLNLSANCKKCNSDFIKNNPGESFCSEKCRFDFMSKLCKHCGTAFLITRGDHNRAFCTVSCSTKYAAAQKGYRICEYCHGEYHGSGKQKFCCKICWQLDHKEREQAQ